MVLVMIEKGSAGELVLGLSFVVVIWISAKRILFFVFKQMLRKQINGWPNLYQVSCADRRTIERWHKQLPLPIKPQQHKVANEIAHRYLHYCGLTMLDAPRPTSESMTCSCGKRHPFVHVFGKCGKCLEAEYNERIYKQSKQKAKTYSIGNQEAKKAWVKETSN